MKLNRTLSASWIAAIPISVALTFSVVAGASSSPVTPASAYYLLGDANNAGAGVTNFVSSSSGDAWHFTATGSSATTIHGDCPNGTACWGVQGTGTGIGVYGSASNSTNTNGTIMGVEGIGGATGTNGTSYGGYFSATNSASGGKAYGLYGTGTTAGVYALSSANGLYAKSTSANGNGVYATGTGASFYGVWADVAGGGFGVVGNSTGGTGLYGSTSGTPGSTPVAGVSGYNSLTAVGTSSANNSAVLGNCTNCNGVYGISANYVGVRGLATGNGTGTFGGMFASNAGTGIYARTATGGTALFADNPNKGAGFYAGVFNGNVRINGNYYATGTKTAVVSTSKGDRLMYAEEATQNYFSDQGTATLKRGRAVVRLDSLFAETVDLTKPYMVFVTPLSFDTAGLGVGNQTARSFEVRELSHGTGAFSFTWRVTALRKGYAKDRMARFDDPTSVDGSETALLPRRPSPLDSPVGAPPTVKVAPKAPRPAAPATKN